jgi:hypothetical protein
VTTETQAVAVLTAAVKKILWEDWDPIGVNHSDHGQDEYDAYVIPICRLLAARPAEAVIHNELVHLAQDIIGLDVIDPDSTSTAARKLYLLTV